MPKRIGNTGVEGMAWAGRIKPFLSAQTKRGEGLERYIKKHHSLFNTEKPLGLTTQRIMRTFFRNNLEKSGEHLGYQDEEVAHYLTAQACSLESQAFSPQQNMDIETKKVLASPTQELIHIAHQIQPQRLRQHRETNRDPNLRLPTLMKTSPAWKVTSAPNKTTAMSASIQRQEEPAGGSETTLTQVTTHKRSGSHSFKNLEAIADKVYRFMQRELILERERANYLGE